MSCGGLWWFAWWAEDQVWMVKTGLIIHNFPFFTCKIYNEHAEKELTSHHPLAGYFKSQLPRRVGAMRFPARSRVIAIVRQHHGVSSKTGHPDFLQLLCQPFPYFFSVGMMLIYTHWDLQRCSSRTGFNHLSIVTSANHIGIWWFRPNWNSCSLMNGSSQLAIATAVVKFAAGSCPTTNLPSSWVHLSEMS